MIESLATLLVVRVQAAPARRRALAASELNECINILIVPWHGVHPPVCTSFEILRRAWQLMQPASGVDSARAAQRTLNLDTDTIFVIPFPQGEPIKCQGSGGSGPGPQGS